MHAQIQDRILIRWFKVCVSFREGGFLNHHTNFALCKSQFRSGLKTSSCSSEKNVPSRKQILHFSNFYS